MTETICDRCGKHVAPNGDRLSGTFDLCSECFNQFRDWVFKYERDVPR